jgi:hypothetical protein
MERPLGGGRAISAIGSGVSMRGRIVEVVPGAVVHGQIRGQIRELAVVVV